MSQPRLKNVPVTKRALVQRLNRKLAEMGQLLRKSRGARAIQDAGEYFVVDLEHNVLLHKNVDLEIYGKQLESLKPWERLVSNG